MSTIDGLAKAVDNLQTRLLAADQACIETINTIMAERDDIIQHIATTMDAAANHLEKHRAMIHSILRNKDVNDE